jgi:hypothetical protein
MKTQRSTRRTRPARQRKERLKPDSEHAVRLCEEAAARIKAAGEDLAECWMTLGRELSTGASALNLLRKRAWCNVLELRLKEQAQALEDARQGLDSVWQDVMAGVRSRELLHQLLRKTSAELSAAHHVWPILASAAVNPVRSSIAAKK